MDKRNRLGWVPMLLKAYNDAKQALEAKMQELEQNQPSAGDTAKQQLSAPLTKQPQSGRSYLQDVLRSVTEPETRNRRSYLQAPPQSVDEPETRRTRSYRQVTPRSVDEPKTRSTRSYRQATPRSMHEPETRGTRSYRQASPPSLPESETRATHTRSYVQAPMRSRVSAKTAKKQTHTNNRLATRSKRQENGLNYPRVMPSSYQSVVRELRETRRRLNQIEIVQTDRLLSIQEELKRMQEKIDRRILEITSAIGKHRSHRT